MIFKIQILVDNQVSKILVFYGIEKKVSSNPIDPITRIHVFDDEEITFNETNNIPVMFIPMFIHYDDTIHMVRTKILLALQSESNFVSSSMYLFGKTEQGIYTSIGQIGTQRYNVNPYLYIDELSISQTLPNNTKYKIAVDNENLLFQYGFFEKNIINVCFFLDASEKAKKVVSENISLPEIEKLLNQIFFHEKTGKELSSHISRDVMHNIHNVDLLTGMYIERTSELPYEYTGIKMIKLNFQYQTTPGISLPLEMIFKKYSSSSIIPLIKYNPGFKRENIYRLYCETKTAHGKNIPILSKIAIFKLVKLLGHSKSISFYILHKNREIHMEIYETGVVSVNVHLHNTPMGIDELNILLLQSVNPILVKIQDILKNIFSSIDLSFFTSVTNHATHIESMDYEMKISMKRKMDIYKYVKCLRSVFIIETPHQWKYTRVSNYNKEHSIEIFIIDSIKNKLGVNVIIDTLVNSYSLTQKEAIQKITKITNEIQIELNVRKRLIEIKENSGFDIHTFLDTRDETLTISITNIDDIFYITSVPIFIDSILRLSIDPKSTKISKTLIDKLCIDKSKTKVSDIDEHIQLRKKLQSIENKIIDNEIISKEIPIAAEVEEVDDMEYVDEETNLPDEEIKIPEEDDSELDDENEMMQFLYDMEDTDTEDVEESNIRGGMAKKNEEFMSKLYEGEEDEDEEEQGGVEEEEVIHKGDSVKNIIGMKLHNPYYFKGRLEKLAPYIFTKDKGNGMNNYSRLCQSSTKRQPVVITQAELDEINERQPGYLKPEDILKYGTTKEDTNYFICPRYWCLLTDKMMTKEEVERGDCGGKVLSVDDNEVKKDHYIYEFAGKDHYPKGPIDKTRDTYIKHYPGFSSMKFSDGTCVPCCFKNWNTPSILKRKEGCRNALRVTDEKEDENINNHESPQSQIQSETNKIKDIGKEKSGKRETDEPTVPTPETNTKLIYEYIFGPEKFPIPSQRFGYLPVVLQKFFNDFHINCQVSSLDTRIKPNYNCLVRHGVEYSDKQSFVACISDAYSYISQPHILSIKEFKEVIISSLTIDGFITYQNGTLVTKFQPFLDVGETIDEVFEKEKGDISLLTEYRGSELFLSMNLSNNHQTNYIKNVIMAYENFILYLRDDDVIIDYSYLWDILSKPNKLLFEFGLNLLVLVIPEDDNTSNIELVCPNNHYSGIFYESRKPSLIIIQQGNYFEPIYSFKNIGKKVPKIKIKKTFTDFDAYLNPPIKNFIQKVVKPIFENPGLCFPQKSMPNMYKFKHPILLFKLIYELSLRSYEVDYQIMNFQSKIIGLMVSHNGRQTVVPCYPSSMHKDYAVKYITDVEWTTYSNTVDFLKKLHNSSNGVVPCKPLFKVIEDDHIIGILTETDQFIQINPFLFVEDIISSEDDLIPLNEGNYLLADEEMAFTRKEDEDRVGYVNYIRNKYKSYNEFRNHVRNSLHKQENSSIKINMEDEIKKRFVLFSVKRQKISDMIQQLVDGYEFDDNNVLKLSDELIRYKRIYTYMFQPNLPISFGDDEYVIQNSELLILQTNLLEENYIENLVPVITNKYTKYIDYDNVEPRETQAYSNEININAPKEIIDCESEVVTITSTYWKKIFPPSLKELKYKNYIRCGYIFIIDIIQKIKGVSFSIQEIKTLLVREYDKYYKGNGMKILDILRYQGNNIIQQVKSNISNLSFYILSDEYYITYLDIYILFHYLKIPTFIISNKPLMETKYMSNVKCLYKNNVDLSRQDFIILFSYPVTKKIPLYSVITDTSNDDNILFNIPHFHQKVINVFTSAFDDYKPFDIFLDEYKIDKKTKYARKNVDGNDATKTRTQTKQMGGTCNDNIPIITF